MKKQWQALPLAVKGLVIVGSAVVAGILIHKGVRAIREVAGRGSERGGVRSTKDDLKECLKTQSLSYAESQYKNWANQLEEAFSGCGTAYVSTVYPIMRKMKNECDVLKLIAVYGIRTYKGCRILGMGEKALVRNTLPQALTSELTITELPQINGVLRDNNINYQF